jgi:hypothetical protein
MFGWGVTVFLGLILIFWDLKPATRARLSGNPMLVHAIVIGSGLVIHGGSAEGAMAAIVSGIFSALYFRGARYMYGYLKRGVWHPGVFRLHDPRTQGALA